MEDIKINSQNDVKKVLCEQLALLAEKSKMCDTNSLITLTDKMVSISQVLLSGHITKNFF